MLLNRAGLGQRITSSTLERVLCPSSGGQAPLWHGPTKSASEYRPLSASVCMTVHFSFVLHQLSQPAVSAICSCHSMGDKWMDAGVRHSCPYQDRQVGSAQVQVSFLTPVCTIFLCNRRVLADSTARSSHSISPRKAHAAVSGIHPRATSRPELDLSLQPNMPCQIAFIQTAAEKNY